ncbi:MAG: glucose-1-phosphate adenylyltransferase [Actinomycetota bacterium]|nr:glucose-1-phosphate adenylyltransferase [Actinomycetota bacterium]
MASPRVLAMVLAGGEGKRLFPLTADRAKPAVPFAGHYRLIDFALSNLANGGFLQIVVLTQYKSHSLDLHISRTWRLSDLLNEYVTTVPAQMRLGPKWFSGSADAIHQNLNLVGDERPDHILVFGADHIYRMDPRQMLEQHIATGAGVTVAAIGVPLRQASEFGVLEPGPDTAIARFSEKPTDPTPMVDHPDLVMASMGNYIFTTQTLVDAVVADAADDSSVHDVGGSIIPALVRAGQAHLYDFGANQVPGATERDRAYWRDVGTLDSFYDAHMDLVSVHPVFNLYNERWPIYTSHPSLPPAKFVLAGQAHDSLVCAGAIISGATVQGSVISPGVLVGTGSLVERSVLMHGVVVEPGAVVRNAILDKNVTVPAGTHIGVDLGSDRSRFTVSDEGVVVIGKGQHVRPE